MKNNNLKYKLISIQFIIILCLTMISNIILIPKEELAASYTQHIESGINAFPADYQPLLNKLKELHPNWNFDAYYTGIPWSQVMANETDCGHNRILESSNSLWKSSCNNVAAGYACASKEIVAYYLDPRNFLNDDIKVFQFLEISYNERIHTVEGIRSLISGTFLNNNVTFTLNGQTKTMHYADIILQAAKESRMSPYSIATKIIQEVGSQGSASVSGNVPNYQGYYNFYNYGAYDGDAAIANGLEYAKKHNWNNQYTAIVEGAKLLADSYTNAGQNTAYFYKWDVVGTSILKPGASQTVDSSSLYTHQFMTNIQDPTSQSSTLYNTYSKNNIINESLNFVIPVYNEMPSSNKLPTNLTEADGALYYLTGTGVRVRSEASTSGTILATLYTLDEIIAVQERECITSGGIKWDKVKLSNGIIGYMASEYLSPCKASTNNQNNEPIIGIAITIDNLRLRESPSTSGVTKTIIPNGQKVDILQKDVAKDGTNIWYKDRYNGMVGYVSNVYLKMIDNNNNKVDATLVEGDVNKDGKITAGDYVLIKRQIMGEITLTDVQLKSADANGDGKVTAGDYVLIKNYIMSL